MMRPHPAPVTRADAALLIGALSAITALSNFHRASLAVIAPQLSAELGLGSAASFMSAVYLCSRWFGPARLAGTVSRVFALSHAGTLLAGTPLAAASLSRA